MGEERHAKPVSFIMPIIDIISWSEESENKIFKM
jgi:hypothetical protein